MKSTPTVSAGRPLNALARLDRHRIWILAAAAVLSAIILGAIAILPTPTPSPSLTPAPVAPSSASPDPTESATPSASAGTSPTVTPQGGTSTADGQRMRLDAPDAPDAPVGLAVFFHGLGGDVNTLMDSDWIRALRAEGWAVASSDFHLNAWGAPETTVDLQSLTSWASDATGMAPTLMISDSMGALTSLNAIVRGGTFVPCWYGVESVVDLRTVESIAGAPAQIEKSYGGKPTVADNPIENVDKLTRNETIFRLIGAENDTIISNSANSLEFSNALRAAGGDVSYRGVAADHGGAALFDATDLTTFAKGCLP